MTDQRIESVRLDSISVNYTDGSKEDPMDWSYTATGEELEKELEDEQRRGCPGKISWAPACRDNKLERE